jgi:MFS family permease
MSVNAFLTLYMTDVLMKGTPASVADSRAAMLISIMYIPGFAGGTVLGGWIGDRIGTVKVIIATSLVSGLAIFWLKVATMGWSFYLLLFVLGVNQAMRSPVTEVFIMSQAPKKFRATVYGIYFFTMQYTGAIFAPIMGKFIVKCGYGNMFTYAAWAVTCICVVTSFFIWDAKD